jgi:lipopolysaccharide export LptBFGC system permease protein LptF
MLKRILIGVGVLVVGLLLFKYCDFKKEKEDEFEYNTNLIQQQILNVGKLVVTEGHFSEVVTFRNSNKYLMDMISFEKKAIVIVNAKVTVAYDLHQMKYDIDEKNKTITILSIPKEEIAIYPDIQYYDVEQSTMNEFTGADYNKINKTVKANIAKKVEKSTLKTNAKNRLVSEISKMLILTNSLGWKLQYNGETIENESQLQKGLKM